MLQFLVRSGLIFGLASISASAAACGETNLVQSGASTAPVELLRISWDQPHVDPGVVTLAWTGRASVRALRDFVRRIAPDDQGSRTRFRLFARPRFGTREGPYQRSVTGVPPRGTFWTGTWVRSLISRPNQMFRVDVDHPSASRQLGVWGRLRSARADDEIGVEVPKPLLEQPAFRSALVRFIRITSVDRALHARAPELVTRAAARVVDQFGRDPSGITK